MTLPISRLPILVIELILQTMEFLDLFLLTHTSTKLKRVVRNMHRTPNHYLFVTIHEILVIRIQSRTNQDYAESINVDAEEYIPYRRRIFNLGTVSVHRTSLVLNTYWNDIKVGCIQLCNELVDVFRAPVYGVELNLDDVENYQNEINWANSTFPGLISFTIHGKCSFQDYMWMIKNSRATEVLEFEMEPTDYPENREHLEVVPLEFESIAIDHGRWMRLQQLEAIKARNIVIEDASLTDQEINMVLRNLQSLNEKSVWKEVEVIFYRESDPEIVLMELNATEGEAPEDALQKWSIEMENGDKCTIFYAEYESDQINDIKFGYEIQIGN